MFRIERRYVNMPEGGGNDNNASAFDTAPRVSHEEQLENTRAICESMVAEAERKAAELLDAAEDEAELLRDKSREEGFQEGYEAGLEKGHYEAYEDGMAAYRSDAEGIKRLIEETKKARDNTLDTLEHEITELILDTAKKVIGTALDRDDDVFMSVIRNALRRIKYQGKVTLKVSREDFARFFPDGKGTFIVGDETITTSVIADEALVSGDCHIESEGETVNAGVDSQMNHITIAFYEPDGMS